MILEVSVTSETTFDDGDPTGNAGLIDEGADGIDNDADGLVDEIAYLGGY